MDTTPLTATALALLPERQAHYDGCCATHARALAAGVTRSVLATQQNVAFALATLNTTRAAAGLSPVVGPRLRSLDELLELEYEASADRSPDAEVEAFQLQEAA
jgi:hypothetical protein